MGDSRSYAAAEEKRIEEEKAEVRKWYESATDTQKKLITLAFLAKDIEYDPETALTKRQFHDLSVSKGVLRDMSGYPVRTLYKDIIPA